MRRRFLLTGLIGIIVLACTKSTIEPDPQFLKVYMHYDFRNEVNTFKNYLQKDLILDGVAQTGFLFSAEEQEKILEKVNSVNYFGFPDTIRYVPGLESMSVVVEPNPGEQFLRIKYHHQDKIVYWYYPLPDNEYARLLLELKDFIVETIESTSEYQSLPEARGGYM